MKIPTFLYRWIFGVPDDLLEIEAEIAAVNARIEQLLKGEKS